LTGGDASAQQAEYGPGNSAPEQHEAKPDRQPERQYFILHRYSPLAPREEN
jgi:hypothetical protein